MEKRMRGLERKRKRESERERDKDSPLDIS